MKKNFWLFALLLACMAFGLDLVKDGKPCAEIIVESGANSGVVLAAKDLQYHLERMSGAKLELLNEPSGKELNRVFVGESRFTRKLGYTLPEFGNSGYDILVKGNYAILNGPSMFFPEEKKWTLEEFQKFMGEKYSMRLFTSGNSNGYNTALGISIGDDVGPMHAVSAFLEELGVRFYAPGEDGTIIPKRNDIAVQTGRRIREAAFGRREYYFGKPMRERAEGMLWLKRLKCGNRIPIVCNHTLPSLIKDPENRVRHPSWYAEESPGKLFPGFQDQGGVPRYTDPDFQRACIEWARKLFDTYPNLKQVTLGAPEDNGDPYDWRDREIYQKPGMSHKQAYANMMYDFHAAVARGIKKTHPDKDVIWWCLYNNCIPTNIDYSTHPDNLVCRVEAIPPSYYVQERRCNEFFSSIQKMFEAFRPRDKSQQWEWWLDYSYDTSPRYPEFFMHRLQKIRQEERNYFDGFFMEIAKDSRSNPTGLGEMPISHLMTYINNKLMWDPDLDMEALLEEYYRLWFGPAAEEMRAFHEYAEEVWCRSGSRSVSEKDGFLKPADIPKYFELLSIAKNQTHPDSVYFRRIDEMEKAYSGLKTLFVDRTPQGDWLEAVILPAASVPDGDLSKYRSRWIELTCDGESQNRTEVAVGVTENRKWLFVGFRCQEADMEGVVANTKFFDRPALLKDDHVRIDVNTPTRNWFSVAVNPEGAVWDECRDLDIINRDALAVLWTPGTLVHVEKKADRWEVEVAIPTKDFGRYGPSVREPWGISFSRVRPHGENRQVFGLKDVQALPSSWRRLWKKSLDCEGRPVNEFGFVVLPPDVNPTQYVVKRAVGEVDIAAAWNSPCWKDVPAAKLEAKMIHPGDAYNHFPDTQVKLQYDSKYIYGLFQVNDCYVQALATMDQQQVCLDSCVEFYVRPAGTPRYFNFEFNCGGKMLLYEIEDINQRKYTRLPVEELAEIVRFHTLPEIVNPEIDEPTVWRLGFRIPIDFFVRHMQVDGNLAGQEWSANFFKCADKTSHPHWLAWRSVPDFHVPDGFGKLIFEITSLEKQGE
ncbi:MAG: DUF4838 domain-containing protein [Victivallales bacterium]|nr:DUF4838 domain-containing protein [Victivallales bacterium]